ncbi:MAG: hypothetical protein JSR76_08495, partial [Verrucomicrobia bacterium]|nr:hypothetical protein [Verrucomicrobiota bacterium]
SVEERIEACVTATFSDILLQRDRVTFLEKRAIVVYNCQKKQHRGYIPLPLTNVPGFRSIGPPKPVQLFPNEKWCLVALNVVEELYNHKDVTPASDEMKFRIPYSREDWYLEKRTIVAITDAFRAAHLAPPPRRALTLPSPTWPEALAALPVDRHLTSPCSRSYDVACCLMDPFYVSPRILKDLEG